MRFIFLDIDGVLVPYHLYSRRKPSDSDRYVCHDLLPPHGCLEFDPGCVAELNMIASAAKASIVVSSSWRYSIQNLEKMRMMMNDQGVNAAISGMTPLAAACWKDNSRGAEVRRFLEPLDELVESFVILDDCDMGWVGLEDRWVHTDGKKGLTRSDAVKAIKILDTMPMEAMSA